MGEKEEKKVLTESRLLQNSRNSRNTKNIAGPSPKLFIKTVDEEISDVSKDISIDKTIESNKKS